MVLKSCETSRSAQTDLTKNIACWIGDPVLRNSSDLNIRNRRFSSLLLRQNRSKPLRFFVVLIGLRRYFNVRIVGFCHSKNLTKLTVPARIRTLDPYITIQLLLHCTTTHLVILYFFVFKTIWDRQYRQKTTIIDTSYCQNRQYRRKLR